ncbi:methylenetetrahydrofolate reductase [Caminibacter pacificus]
MNSLKDNLKDKLITLETTPPKSPTLDDMLEKLEKSKAYEYVDGFSTTDCPLSKLKYNSIIAAFRLQEKFKKPVIATMTMRDRNKIALQSDLLGANDLGITNILALTGDPAKMSDQPNVKGVVEGSSLLLLEIIRAFNNGMDYGGKEFNIKPKPITPFAVSNSYAKNFSTIERKIFKKVKNYAVGIITQPVYDIEIVDKMIAIRNKVRKEFEDERKEFEIIFGFFPITRLKTAQFLHSHVPGIYVPDKWIEKLIKAHKISEEEEYKVGLELSRNLFQKLLKIHPKIHIMTANRFEIVKELF